MTLIAIIKRLLDHKNQVNCLIHLNNIFSYELLINLEEIEILETETFSLNALNRRSLLLL